MKQKNFVSCVVYMHNAEKEINSFMTMLHRVIKEEFEKPYYKQLRTFLDEEYRNKTIYPIPKYIYTALRLTPYKDTRVVILGQDPYHEPGQAHGLAFSVSKGVQVPPSLQNIYKELHDDLGCTIPNHGFLVDWAKQGVLLLNAVLTVQAHRANSHKGKGWEIFTDKVIELLNQMVVLLFLRMVCVWQN